jgi:hypothetical protein
MTAPPGRLARARLRRPPLSLTPHVSTGSSRSFARSRLPSADGPRQHRLVPRGSSGSRCWNCRPTRAPARRRHWCRPRRRPFTLPASTDRSPRATAALSRPNVLPTGSAHAHPRFSRSPRLRGTVRLPNRSRLPRCPTAGLGLVSTGRHALPRLRQRRHQTVGRPVGGWRPLRSGTCGSAQNGLPGPSRFRADALRGDDHGDEP